MDFFEYAFIVRNFTLNEWVPYLIGGLCFALVFVFQAVALYTIASREGYKNKWMAFIPFFNTYYIGVCAQKNKFYNISTKTIGLILAIVEVLLTVLYIIFLSAEGVLKSGGYLITVEEEIYMGVTAPVYQLKAVPDNLEWASWIFRYMDRYIIRIVNMIFIILEAILLLCFFQTYACRRYVLFAVTSVLFPIMGVLFFIVRNNKGVNYKDFIRAEQARQYQQYQQFRQQNFDNNPYNQNYNSYNRNPYDNRSGSGNASDPFDDLGSSGNSKGSDPFDDFDKH